MKKTLLSCNIFNVSNQFVSKIYAYILIAVIGFLLIQYFMPVLKLSGLVEKFTQRKQLKEGMNNYQNYDSENNDPLFIARKNSSNISHLKEKLDELNNLQQTVNEISEQVEKNSKLIATINEANINKSENIANSTKELNVNDIQ